MIMRNLKRESAIRLAKAELQSMYDIYEKQQDRFMTRVISDVYGLLNRGDPIEISMKLRAYIDEVKEARAHAEESGSGEARIPDNPFARGEEKDE